MTNHKKTIKSINLEYADLLKKELSFDDIFKCDGDIQSLTLEFSKRCRFDDSRLVIPQQNELLSPFEYRIQGIIKNIKEFWKDKKDAYLGSLFQLDGLKVHTDNHDVNRLGMYFDTILINDIRTSFNERIKESNSRYTSYAYALHEMHKSIPILKAETDNPIIALIPDIQEEHESQSFSNKPKLLNYQQTALEASEYTNRFLNNISNIGKLETINDWVDLDIESNTDCNQIIDLKKYLDFLEFSGTSIDSIMNIVDTPLMDFVTKKSNKIDVRIWHLVVNSIFVRFMELADLENLSRFSNSDPLIPYENSYRSKCEIASKLLKTHLIPEELIAAYSLYSPKFQWLERLSNEDLLRFRDNSGLEFIRTAFRKQRSKVKYATVDEFDDIASTLSEDLIAACNEHNERLRKEEKEYKKKLGITSASFAVTVSLGIVSICIPPLAAVTIPAAAFSTLLGSASAKDILNEVVTRKRRSSDIAERPTGILLKYSPSSEE